MRNQVGFLDGILRELRFWSKFEKSKKSEIKGCGVSFKVYKGFLVIFVIIIRKGCKGF